MNKTWIYFQKNKLLGVSKNSNLTELYLPSLAAKKEEKEEKKKTGKDGKL